MAAKSEWSCPICHDDQDDMAYMSPCLHQFCLGCALRWAWQRPNCPLCRSGTTAVLFSVRSDDDCLVFDVPSPAEPPAQVGQHEQGAAGPAPSAQAGSFPPAAWADFFKSHPDNTRPLLPWLRRELGALFQHRWWEVAAAEGTVVAHLCLYGLEEEELAQRLQNCLPGDAAAFVRRLVATTVRVCAAAVCRHLARQGPRAVWLGDDRPAASPTAAPSSPAASGREDRPSASEAALRRGAGRPPSAPVPAEEERPREEPGRAAAAGPSAQGCGRRPSAPGRGRDRSPGGPRRPPDGRAPGPQHSPRPRRAPPRQPQ